MGVERAVTRWYVRRQVIQQDIALQQMYLAQVPSGALERLELERRLHEAHRRLLNLGPCPKSLMG